MLGFICCKVYIDLKLRVAEMEAILPYLQCVHRDSAWATHGCPLRYHVEDVHQGEVGLDHLLDHIMNYGHSWCLSGSRVS
jgi:hypothetical protein